MHLSDLEILAKKYVEHGIQVKPEALERIKWHQAQGHRCIIVSASIETYLEPWAKAKGFSDVVSSKVETDENGRITGNLIGHNCRGLEKVKRIEKLLGPKENYLLYAYGDSKGDKEMLDFADHAFYRTFK
jgi:phosphatidylglycerophosphatase C